MKTRRNLYIENEMWKNAESLARDLNYKEKKNYKITDIFRMAMTEFLIKNGYNIKDNQPKPKKSKNPNILDELNIGDNKYIFFDNGFVAGPEKIENFHEILKYYPDNHLVKKRCVKLYQKSEKELK